MILFGSDVPEYGQYGLFWLPFIIRYSYLSIDPRGDYVMANSTSVPAASPAEGVMIILYQFSGSADIG